MLEQVVRWLLWIIRTIHGCSMRGMIPHFLTSALGYFGDSSVGFVQAPQVYYNQDASFVARGAAEETYGFYSVHDMASYSAGHPIIVFRFRHAPSVHARHH